MRHSDEFGKPVLARLCQVILILSLALSADVLIPTGTPHAQEAAPDILTLRDAAYAAGELDLLTRRDMSWPTSVANEMTISDKARLQTSSGVYWDHLVFQSWRDGNWEIYSARSDGTGATRLTDSPALDIHPRMTSDMSRIVFVSDRMGSRDIFSMRFDGTDLRRITTHHSREDYPSWSPDGQRIVFSGTTDGNLDLFVMNANGSNQTRITSDSEDDIMPSWSPDGNQIAWVNTQGAHGRLMVANADGSNVRQLCSLRYLQHPVWGRDGSYIAFDADADDDYWNELMSIGATASALRVVYDANTNFADVTMGAWSYNSLELAATLTLYTVQDNALYVSAAGFLRMTPDAESVIVLSGSGLDMHPDWQPIDWDPPTATVHALPAESPSPIVVNWSGTDNGPSGVATYDIQVRTLPNGRWTNWLTSSQFTSEKYAASGGKTYEFRARATDRAGNTGEWPSDAQAATTVESLAPISRIAELHGYARQSGLIHFVGSDPGGSGIQSHEAECRSVGSSHWTTFAKNVAGNEAEFWCGSPMGTYVLRSYASDRAGNTEPKHPFAGDQTVTVYSWGATGQATDHVGRPLADVIIAADHAVFAGGTSEASGEFYVYGQGWIDNYSLTWSKEGYGTLPTTSYARTRDVQLAIAIPPLDNLIANSHFEHGLGDGWTSAGVAMPVISEDAAHTGAAGVRLGYMPFIAGSEILPVPAGSATNPQLLRDSVGALHLVWEAVVGAESSVYYARRTMAGDWSIPKRVSGDSASAHKSRMAIDPNGALHVVWEETGTQSSVFYARRALNGNWSTPESLGAGWSPSIAVEDDGVLHCVWGSENRIAYRWRATSGQWSTSENLVVNADENFWCEFVIDEASRVHVFWPQREIHSDTLGYSRRDTDGAWTPALPAMPERFQLLSIATPAIGADGQVNLLLWGYGGGGSGWVIRALVLNAEGDWIARDVGRIDGVIKAVFALDSQGQNHILWQVDTWEEPDDVYYALGTVAGGWEYQVRLERGAGHPAGNRANISLALDGDDRAHVVYVDALGEVRYIVMDSAAKWPTGEEVSCSPGRESLDPRIVLSPSEEPEIVWTEVTPDSGDELDIVHSNPAAPQTGDSILRQTVTIPADMAGATPSFFYRAQGTLNGTNRFDVRIDDAGSAQTIFSATETTDAWQHAWADVSQWAGKTVTLEFRMHQTAGQRAGWVDLDEVTLGAGHHADLHAHAGSQIGTSDEPITIPLHYGNRGDASVAGTTITLTLPSELTFVSANPPPATTGPSLSWQIGSLPAGATATIELMASIAEGTPDGTLIEAPYGIDVAQGEIETGNNAGNLIVFVGGRQTYLPVVH